MRSLLTLLISFIIIHISYHFAGITFDMAPLEYSWQYADPALLKEKLFETLLYLHSQPPLFNLFLGIILKTGQIWLFKASYIFFALVLCFSLYLIMKKLGIGDKIALPITILFTASPSFILYENWLGYTMPVTALLTFSILAFINFSEKKSINWGTAFFLTLFLLCGIRGLFHLVYFIAIFIGVLIALPNLRKKAFIAGLIPFVLVFSMFLKNYILFGTFGTSSWLGMNFASYMTRQIPPSKKENLIEQGELSKSARLFHPFSSLEKYRKNGVEVSEVPEKFKDIDILNEEVKSFDDNAVNFNHYAYIDISKDQMKDAKYMILHYPEIYIQKTAMAWILFLSSSSELFLLKDNMAKIPKMRFIYNKFLYGEILVREGVVKNFYIILAVGIPILILFFISKLFPISVKNISLRQMVIYLILFNILYISFISNLFEVSENNRYRFTIDPLILVLLGIWISDLIKRKNTVK